jgi:hypothetical protein
MTIFSIWYPPANRIDSSYQGPTASTVEAEIIDTIFEQLSASVGILKLMCN